MKEGGDGAVGGDSFVGADDDGGEEVDVVEVWVVGGYESTCGEAGEGFGGPVCFHGGCK